MWWRNIKVDFLKSSYAISNLDGCDSDKVVFACMYFYNLTQRPLSEIFFENNAVEWYVEHIVHCQVEHCTLLSDRLSINCTLSAWYAEHCTLSLRCVEHCTLSVRYVVICWALYTVSVIHWVLYTVIVMYWALYTVGVICWALYTVSVICWALYTISACDNMLNIVHCQCGTLFSVASVQVYRLRGPRGITNARAKFSN